jgi:hypothetical protein
MGKAERKAKRWRASITRKEDVITLRIALLLRSVDYDWERRSILAKATAFIGDWDTAARIRKVPNA